MKEKFRTLAGRLRWAIKVHQPREGRQRGIRLFQRRIAARAKEIGAENLGTTLTSIQSYIRDEDPVTPSLDFLREAADVLNVREEWLILNEGGPTRADEIVLGRIGEAIATPAREQKARIETAFSKGAGFDLPVRDHLGFGQPGPALVVLLRLWRRFCHRLPRTDDREKAEIQVAERLGEAVAAPLKATGITSNFSHSFLEGHVLAMAPVLERILDLVDRDSDEEA